MNEYVPLMSRLSGICLNVVAKAAPVLKRYFALFNENRISYPNSKPTNSGKLSKSLTDILLDERPPIGLITSKFYPV